MSVVCSVINMFDVQRLAVLESVISVAMEPAFLRKMLNVTAFPTALTRAMKRTVVSFTIVTSNQIITLNTALQTLNEREQILNSFMSVLEVFYNVLNSIKTIKSSYESNNEH